MQYNYLLYNIILLYYYSISIPQYKYMYVDDILTKSNIKIIFLKIFQCKKYKFQLKNSTLKSTNPLKNITR